MLPEQFGLEPYIQLYLLPLSLFLNLQNLCQDLLEIIFTLHNF